MSRLLHRLTVILVSLLFALPLLWMIQTASLADGAPSLAAFAALWQDDFLPLLGNTLLIAVGAALLSLLMAFLAAYGLVRYRFPAGLDKLFLLLVLMIKMMPPIVIAIPLYDLMNQTQLLNTRLGLVLSYQIYTLPFAIWMLLGFLREVPLEIDEAGALDGANLGRRLWYIVLPLCAPGMVATLIFTSLLGWNEFMFSLLFIHTPDRFTLPLYIARGMTEDGTVWNSLMASGLIASLPMLLLAGYLQKYLLRGFSMGLK
ncbi:carbohydrate ABC transporter permease [Pseudaeromonas sp. ZJS20]|uniref:carbohydrate ABC transporter permease n=1 Tax=Pseudaeromonas aegiceratis TaxID=3153928 RepID=UPI00390C62AC